MSAALMAQPGLHSTAMAISVKVEVKGRNRKRKKNTMAGGKNTMAGGACATTTAHLQVERWTGPSGYNQTQSVSFTAQDFAAMDETDDYYYEF